MKNITFETICSSNIEQCRELCDELMTFQKSKAYNHPEYFDSMNFDTRLKKSYENSLRSQIIIAKDEGVAIGYVFSTIETVDHANKNILPDWIPAGESGKGFYPDWVELPQNIGLLNNLYLREEYREIGLGSKLFSLALEWLKSFSDVNLIFVYISNGNEAALKFYLEHGFIFSHDVFSGFIKAVYKK